MGGKGTLEKAGSKEGGKEGGISFLISVAGRRGIIFPPRRGLGLAGRG